MKRNFFAGFGFVAHGMIAVLLAGCASGGRNITGPTQPSSAALTIAPTTGTLRGRSHAILVRHEPNGIPDDLIANGPTIISTASLDAVCSWFPGMTIAKARRRFRTTLEIDGVPAFWEDRLFGAEIRSVVRFSIGEVAFEGSYPCIRCPISARDPHTGVETIGFQKRFTQLRQAQLPIWSHAERFEHYYCLATNTRVASTEAGKHLNIADALIASCSSNLL